MQVSMQIALLERRSISELQEIWKKYFDALPTTYNKEFYISRIAHRIKEYLKFKLLKCLMLVLKQYIIL